MQQPSPNTGQATPQGQQGNDLFVVAYTDTNGRKRNRFGQVIGDDGKLYDVNGNEIDTSRFS